MGNYDQNIDSWINPNDPSSDNVILSKSTQNKYMDLFYQRYFGATSPWSADYINQLIGQSAPNDFKSIEIELIANFNNENKPIEENWLRRKFSPLH